MDENRWVDNVLCLNESAKKLLLGLHAIQQMLKRPERVKKELFIDNHEFKPIPIKDLKIPDIRALLDGSMTVRRRSILKSFPKRESSCHSTDVNLEKKLKPIYEILCHTVDFLEYSNICIRQSLKIIKLSVFLLR
jgi:hypothetical protein